jgi:hypothetical protein
MKDVQRWKQQEQAKKHAAMDKVMQFKAMRESQVKDKQERLQRVGVSKNLSYRSRMHGNTGLRACGLVALPATKERNH